VSSTAEPSRQPKKETFFARYYFENPTNWAVFVARLLIQCNYILRLTIKIYKRYDDIQNKTKKVYREEEQGDHTDDKTLPNPRLLMMVVSDAISGSRTTSSPATRVKTTPSNALE
jgi:hypothetical protein